MREKDKKAQEKPWEKPGEYLKNAEMAVEGNYNMVGDGLVNNLPPQRDDLIDGQSWDETCGPAPETLPEARPGKKPSVMAFLKAASGRAPAATGKKQPRHGMDRDL